MIIKYHKEKEFKSIPEKKLMDFVRIKHNSAREIVGVWAQHFESIGVPYAIEAIGNTLILWKERRV